MVLWESNKSPGYTYSQRWNNVIQIANNITKVQILRLAGVR
jgi:hypothetical protein